MAKAPKCKLCGAAHFSTQPHATTNVAATRNVAPAWKSIPKATQIVAAVVVPEREMIYAATQPEHECPICGLLHHRSLTATERSRKHRSQRG